MSASAREFYACLVGLGCVRCDTCGHYHFTDSPCIDLGVAPPATEEPTVVRVETVSFLDVMIECASTPELRAALRARAATAPEAEQER